MDPNLLTSKINAGESFLLANDGQFLGKLSLNQFDAESISNSYGLFGSQYSATSIFNKYGNYGSQYSALSPFNRFTSTPPMIYLKGRFFGYLTKNVYMGPSSIDPDNLIFYLRAQNLNF